MPPSCDPGGVRFNLGAKDRFDQAIADFAESYANQNDRDHAALGEAIDTGRVTAQTGIQPTEACDRRP